MCDTSPVPRRDERGASAVEYGLLVALFVLVLVISVWAFQNTVEWVFGDTACNQSNGYECEPPP